MSRFLSIRRLLGITQEEMAEILGCTQSNVSFLERGQMLKPDSAQRLIAGASALGVRLTLEHVYGDAVLPPPRASVPRMPGVQDWPRITHELRRRGWTPLLLAARFGAGIAEVSKLFETGDDPRHALGAAVLRVHEAGEVPSKVGGRVAA